MTRSWRSERRRAHEPPDDDFWADLSIAVFAVGVLVLLWIISA